MMHMELVLLDGTEGLSIIDYMQEHQRMWKPYCNHHLQMLLNQRPVTAISLELIGPAGATSNRDSQSSIPEKSSLCNEAG